MKQRGFEWLRASYPPINQRPVRGICHESDFQLSSLLKTIRLCRLSPKVRLDFGSPQVVGLSLFQINDLHSFAHSMPALNSWFTGTTLHDLAFHGDHIGALPSQGQNCQTENGPQADQHRRAFFLSNKLAASSHWHSSCTPGTCSRRN